ncbi:hypothetical protein L916_11917, partial [Phytophthora nicotianae]
GLQNKPLVAPTITLTLSLTRTRTEAWRRHHYDPRSGVAMHAHRRTLWPTTHHEREPLSVRHLDRSPSEEGRPPARRTGTRATLPASTLAPAEVRTDVSPSEFVAAASRGTLENTSTSERTDTASTGFCATLPAPEIAFVGHVETSATLSAPECDAAAAVRHMEAGETVSVHEAAMVIFFNYFFGPL